MKTPYLFRLIRTVAIALGLIMLLTTCKKDKDKNEPASFGTVTDIDGNVYKTIVIGTQEWMAENLKVTHYRNGDELFNLREDIPWINNTIAGAYCWYNNDISLKDTYGALYNWCAVDDSRGLSPEGWHFPTEAEWTILTDYLGGENEAGGKMKSTRKEPDAHPRWDLPDTGATNESGFSGLPGGHRSLDGPFFSIGAQGSFWSSRDSSSRWAWTRVLSYDNSNVKKGYAYIVTGLSVRCIRD